MIIALEYYNYRSSAVKDITIDKGSRALKEINDIYFYPKISFDDHSYVRFSIRENERNDFLWFYTSVRNAEYLSKELYSRNNDTPIYVPCTPNEIGAHLVPDYDQRYKLLMSEVDISNAIKLLISGYKLIYKDHIDSRSKTILSFDQDEFVIKSRFSEHHVQKYTIETFYRLWNDDNKTFLVWEECE